MLQLFHFQCSKLQLFSKETKYHQPICSAVKGHTLSKQYLGPETEQPTLGFRPELASFLVRVISVGPHPSVLTGLQEAVTQTCIHIAYSVTEPHFFKHSLYSCHGPHKTKGKHSRNIKKLKHLLTSEVKPSTYFSLVRDRYNNMYFS